MEHPRRSLDRLQVHLVRLLLAGPLDRGRRDERGDVPGWVMVTVMTAGLVAVLTSVAGPQLQRMLSDALGSVR